jgi:hypothetical protein
MVGTDQRLLQQSTALGLLFRNTSTVGATVGVAERMTSRDDLTLDVGPSLVFFDTSTNLQTSATVGWGHTLTPTYQTQLSLGGGRTDLVGAELDPRRVVPLRRDPLYFGLANASITRSTPGGDDTVRFGTNARVDPVLQTIRPQISLDVTSTRRLAGGLSISGSGVASTVASQTPLPSDPDETGVQLRLTLAWAVDAFSFRLNAAAVGRGPHLARGFEIRQRSLSGGFGVTWSFL